jgi:hypothetical protein
MLGACDRVYACAIVLLVSVGSSSATMDLSGGPRYLKLNDKLMTRGQIVLVECDSQADIDSIALKGCVTKKVTQCTTVPRTPMHMQPSYADRL